MGKRKSRAKPVKRMEQKVPTTFDCPFCNHEKAVDCKIDKDTSIGSIRCRVCNESYQMITNCTYLLHRNRCAITGKLHVIYYSTFQSAHPRSVGTD